MRFMTKGSTMQRHAHRNQARGTRKQKLTHAFRQVLIDRLESRVLLSTGGTPDPGFGQGGYLKGYQVLAVQQDGSLIANKDSASGSSSPVLLYPDGSFESADDGAGQPTPPTNVQADGKYLVINRNTFTTGNSLTRDNPNGSVDTSFGNDGTVYDFTSGTGYPAGSFNPENVAVVGNHILVVGPLNLGGGQPLVPALVLLNLDGSIDHSFGSSGVTEVIPPDHLTSNPPVSFTAGPLIVRDDERIFVSNNYTFADGTSADYVISYLPDWGANTSVSGFIYQDVNFNGIYDSGDQPLRYWKVYVDLNQNGSQDAFEPTAYTDYNGYYKIHGLQPGTYNVRVVGGIRTFSWAEATPYSPPLHTFTVSSGQVATGNDFGIYPIDQMSTFTGSVYNDTGSGSGAGIPNWTVYVDLNNNGILDPNEPSTPTDESGNFTILTAVGTRVIRAVPRPGWTQTQPAGGSGRTVTITAGYNTSDVSFGETQSGSISGTFFYDSNTNGVWDSGEAPSPYWGVYIDANNDGKYDSGDTEVIANGAGQFTFKNLAPGTYTIRGTTASGWTQTFPSNGGAQTVTVGSGQAVTGINFGEFHGAVSTAKGSISGTFFYDSNHNGVWDSGEPISPYWGVYIDANNDGKYDSGDTEIIANSKGQFTFPNLPAGTYVIRGTTASGWTQTSPANGGAQIVTIVAGQNLSNINFGEYHGVISAATGSISGTFFYDSNANGIWDAGETDSPSWGVYIDANDDGVYDSGDTELIANTHGQYTFSNLSAGTYVIRATTASGWKQTYPANGGAQVITLAAGQNATGINFGKVRT